nr:heme transporter CcmB [uncultured Gemmiger sp.]
MGKKLLYGALTLSGLLTVLQPLTGPVVHKLAASVFLLLCVGHMLACRKKLTGTGVALLAVLLAAFITGVPALVQGGTAGAVHAVLGILCLCAMAAHGFARRRVLKSSERKQET